MRFNTSGVMVDFRLKSGSFSHVWVSAYGRSGRAGYWFGDLPLRPGCPVLSLRGFLVSSSRSALVGAIYRRAFPDRYARGSVSADPPDATPYAQLDLGAIYLPSVWVSVFMTLMLTWWDWHVKSKTWTFFGYFRLVIGHPMSKQAGPWEPRRQLFDVRWTHDCRDVQSTGVWLARPGVR